MKSVDYLVQCSYGPVETMGSYSFIATAWKIIEIIGFRKYLRFRLSRKERIKSGRFWIIKNNKPKYDYHFIITLTALTMALINYLLN